MDTQNQNKICVKLAPATIAQQIAEKILPLVAYKLSDMAARDEMDCQTMNITFRIEKTKDDPFADFAEWNIEERASKTERVVVNKTYFHPK